MKLINETKHIVSEMKKLGEDFMMITVSDGGAFVIENCDAEEGFCIDDIKIGDTIIRRHYEKDINIRTCTIRELIDSFVVRWHIAK